MPSPPEEESLGLSLSGLEREILRALHDTSAGSPMGENELLTRVTSPPDAVRGALQRLRAKGWLLLEETSRERWVLTDRGREAWQRVSRSGGSSASWKPGRGFWRRSAAKASIPTP